LDCETLDHAWSFPERASRDHARMIRHALAPVLATAADALAIPRTLRGRDGVAITFDDGPHPEGTPAVLEILARADARAVFFLVGEQVAARPAVAAEIVSAGHAIALHGHRHRLQLRLDERSLREDLARGRAAIEDATGVSPAIHRPPYGIYSPAGLRSVREAGLTPLLWSRWGKDWRRFTTAARIARRAASGAQAGDVILLHDADFYSARRSHERTAEALPLILAELKRLEHATVLPI
jgi:peptidoglycan/xylan/chitin deacetylase (PgdA/CDA1 family)